jgi:hypothetical protein
VAVSRSEKRQLVVSLLFTVIIAVLLLAFMAVRNVPTQKVSRAHEPAVACGRLVESWDIARGWRKDCGIFPGYAPPPDPFHAPASFATPTHA